MAEGHVALLVIDVSNPAQCVRVGEFDTIGICWGVAVVGDRIYLAASEDGLVVLPTLANVQLTVRVNATTNQPFTLEAATNLLGPIAWTPLVTTNVPVMPFDFVDFDVQRSEKPHKFYRVRQP